MAHHHDSHVYEYEYNGCSYSDPSPGGSGSGIPVPFARSLPRVSDPLSDPHDNGRQQGPMAPTAAAIPRTLLRLPSSPLLPPPTPPEHGGGGLQRCLHPSTTVRATKEASTVRRAKERRVWASTVRAIHAEGERFLRNYREAVMACRLQAPTPSDGDGDGDGDGEHLTDSAIGRVMDVLENFESSLMGCEFNTLELSDLLSVLETDPLVVYPTDDAVVVPKPPATADVTPERPRRAKTPSPRRLSVSPVPEGPVNGRKRKATDDFPWSVYNADAAAMVVAVAVAVSPDEVDGGDDKFAAMLEITAAKAYPVQSLYVPLQGIVKRSDMKRHLQNHPNDVLGGKGGSGNTNLGDRQYRDMTSEGVWELLEQTGGVRPTKELIHDLGRRVMKEVQDVCGGRFLEPVTYGTLQKEGMSFDEPIDNPKLGYGWREKTETKALEKVKQHIRELLPLLIHHFKEAATEAAINSLRL